MKLEKGNKKVNLSRLRSKGISEGNGRVVFRFPLNGNIIIRRAEEPII